MFKYQVIVFGSNNDSKSAIKSKSNNEDLGLQIKEACDKAELQVKQPKPVKKAPVERPASAASTKPSAGSTAPKAVKRPTSAAPKKPVVGGAKKPASSASSSMTFSSCYKT